MFDVAKTTNDIIEWIREWFAHNGPDCRAVVGISGGKDSTIVAALCVKALGKDRVFGVLIPNGDQADIGDARNVVNFLGIENNVTVNISETVKSLQACVEYGSIDIQDNRSSISVTEQAKINLPPRIRMATLYYISQCVNGRVANTCNLSEDWVGYSTRYGDSVGDFSPLSRLTVTEVKQIGHYLGLPDYLVDKVPADGLCGVTDEENLGFTYDVLDKYIRTGVCENKIIKQIIDAKHKKNMFKLELMPCFEYVAD